ncbi:dehydrodolichyl diphosphate synthase 4-like [Chenopodium quinoa]|uniref:dehydrodolichyl diphosphate synthase 4-like n=1 Tax=Chenopodium quinoa TaxID=63459 RepID=UPI000B781E5E|nr:dehydrodolichyl diphosphate synthase 4-like [Chenopodium quinoa]
MEKSPSLILMPFKDDKANTDGNEELPKELRHELMPRHLAVILDGNRRLAMQSGLSPIDGYLHGVELDFLLEVLEHYLIRISRRSNLSFSKGNMIKGKLIAQRVQFRAFFESCHFRAVCYGGRVSVIGDTSLLPNSLQELIEQIEEETKDSIESHLILEMNNSGQNDINHACQTL